MLKDQLLELQHSRKTLVSDYKSSMKFIDDENVDKNMLFDLLPFKTEFTTRKALNFDRHTLSSREEKKFNKKFAPFVKSLLSRMDDPQINILLEFIIRIYNIDTFNSKELQFLLLPFPKYFTQLSSLSMKRDSLFKNMKSYSYPFIASMILKDDYLQADFQHYCTKYTVCQEFVDKMLDLFSEKLQSSVEKHASFLYQIFKILIDCNQADKAIQVYKRIDDLKSHTDFNILFKPFDVNSDSYTPKLNEYEMIYQNKLGKSILNDTVKLIKYLNFLEASNLHPSEFNVNEFNILKNVYLSKNTEISDYNDISQLYFELSSKAEVDKYLLKNNVLSIYRGACIQLTHENYDIELLTNENHIHLIYNMARDLLSSKHFEITCKCASFQFFNPKFFYDFVFENEISIDLIEKLLHEEARESNELIRSNLLKLIELTDYDLVGYLLNKNLTTDILSLSLILSTDKFIDEEAVYRLIDISKVVNKPIILPSLVEFICSKHEILNSSFNIEKFCEWAIENNYIAYLEPIARKFSHLISSEKHYLFLSNLILFDSMLVLEQREFRFLPNLIAAKKYDLLLEIAKLKGIEYVLIEDPGTLEFIEKNHGKLSEYSHSLCSFLIDHISDSRSIRLLMEYSNILIFFRSHPNWPIAKDIILETTVTKAQIQMALDFVTKHIELFDETDQDLFEILLDKKHILDISIFKNFPQTAGSATFVDVYLHNSNDDLIAVLPFISPLLINFKKSSIDILFKRYKNIMATYAKLLLKNSPEKSYLFVDLEPRIVLKELCSHFNSNVHKTFISILSTKECSSSDILNRIIKCFENNTDSLMNFADLSIFIQFYCRSFPRPDNENMSSFIEYLYSFEDSLFFAVAKESLKLCTQIYSSVVKKVEKSLMRGKTHNFSATLEFLCDFLDSEGFEFNDSNRLFDIICDLKNTYSPKLCSFILRNDTSILSDKIQFLLSKINKKEDLGFVLDVIFNVLKNCEESEEYKSILMPNIILLSEDQDQTISDQATKLLELFNN